MPKLGDKYKKAGQIWIVTDDCAGVYTLTSGNGKRPERIVHASELS